MSIKSDIAQIFKSYSKDILGVCFYVLKDVESSKDIVMDTFEVALKHKDFSEIQNPRAWLMQVARNLSLKRFHKDINNTYIGEDQNFDKYFMESFDIKEHIYNDEIQEQLIQEVGLLKPQQSKCIELFYLGKNSYQEISELLKLDIKTVKSNIQNGKRNLKQKLENKIKY